MTDVETGTDMLLLDAWQVRIVWRSSLLNCTNLSSFVTREILWMPSPLSISSETSSNRAWSLHHVTRGVGFPKLYVGHYKESIDMVNPRNMSFAFSNYPFNHFYKIHSSMMHILVVSLVPALNLLLKWLEVMMQ